MQTIAPVTSLIEGFSVRLRQETVAEHRATERSPFIRRLLTGKLPIAGYAAMTAQWSFLYRALEEVAAGHRGHPAIGPFITDDLARMPALADDLGFLLGPNWRDEIAPLPGTVVYVGRLHELGATWTVGLLAHHYLRYLGDLSGGQIIARIVRRTYAFEGDAGTAFYRFPAIADYDLFKSAYRNRLDRLALDERERLRLIGEVDAGYRLTARIFAELDEATTSA